MYKKRLSTTVLDGIEDYPELDNRTLPDLISIRDDLAAELKICNLLIRELSEDDPDSIEYRLVYDLSVNPNTRRRLADFISRASFGAIEPRNATLKDVLESAYDLDAMPSLGFKNQRPMFQPNVCKNIVEAFAEHDIDYYEYRRWFKENRTGTSMFIVDLGLTKRTNTLLFAELRNHNATVADLLNYKLDLVEFPGISFNIAMKIQEKLKEHGIDYRRERDNW